MRLKKIDIYVKHFKDKKYYYCCTTITAKTCKEAKQRFCATHCLDSGQVKTTFSKS